MVQILSKSYTFSHQVNNIIHYYALKTQEVNSYWLWEKVKIRYLSENLYMADCTTISFKGPCIFHVSLLVRLLLCFYAPQFLF